MKHSGINFVFNGNEKIVLEIKKPIEQLYCYCETPIVFKLPGCDFLLSVDDIYENMLIFHKLLSQALCDEAPLHESIQSDIGYVYNSYMRHTYSTKPVNDETPICTLVYVKRDAIESWVGYNYNLWCHDCKASWLYNAADGSIVFEVTPVYPFDTEDDKNGISYEEWIKTYKPYLVRTIPRDVAEQWLMQANDILEQIKKIWKKNEKGI
jgi:hypothetical protein